MAQTARTLAGLSCPFPNVITTTTTSNSNNNNDRSVVPSVFPVSPFCRFAVAVLLGLPLSVLPFQPTHKQTNVQQQITQTNYSNILSSIINI